MSSIPTTMRALRAHARGGPEQLVYEEAPTPVPGPGEALVEVHAGGITFAELTWDETWSTRDGLDRTPTIPSHEVSGVVIGLGPGASGVTVRDEVYGLIDFDRNGAAAQWVTLPAAHLAARPRSLSHVDTATLPLAALTAWQALVDHAALKPGERVLVQGGAGGVGSLAVQLAASLGGAVTATGRAAQREFVLGLGAGAFESTDDASPAAAAREDGFDVVIDAVGGPVLDASYPRARRGGRLVTLSAPPDQEKAAALGVDATFFVVAPDAAELAHLATLVDDGKLRPVLSQTFPLRDGRKAFESATVPHPPGKTVLTVR
ncbi:MAG TPA: NADP-dependent oxidoreductase [Trebonia sp.]|jgi:NADPH:quinone reductase-like Zn-dependent oxidoreductase|nr:NADP-dependent oxidoreductase [Trebonia sp.]